MSSAAPIHPIERSVFGVVPSDGSATSPRNVGLFTLRTTSGARVVLSEYGATVVSLEVPDRSGKPGQVVLGFSSLSGYLGEHPYIGSTVGRYANRIAGASFELDGRRVTLPANDGRNHLHGGPSGFSRRVFNAEAGPVDGAPAVEFQLVSPAGDQGYPGRLEASVRFRLVETGDAITLEIEYRASTDAPTVVSMTHHGYFNLCDGGRGDVLDHELTILADHALHLDDAGIPADEPIAIAGTRLDFRSPTDLGPRIAEHGGYDDCYMLPSGGDGAGNPRLVASVREPRSGRRLDVLTDQPALQFYTANSFDGSLVGRDSVRYQRHAGLCLETQHPPDAPNRPGLPSARLDPGETYAARTHYRFGIDG